MTDSKMGRPTSYTKTIGDAICEKLSNGSSLNTICKNEDMPHRSTVHRWLLSENPEHDDFRDKYALARRIGYELMEDDILDIADDGSNDWMEVNDPNNPGFRVNGESVGRSRLRVETRKWYMSKVLPKFKDGTAQVAEAINNIMRVPYSSSVNEWEQESEKQHEKHGL